MDSKPGLETMDKEIQEEFYREVEKKGGKVKVKFVKITKQIFRLTFGSPKD